MTDYADRMASLKVSTADWWPAETRCVRCGAFAPYFYRGKTYCQVHLHDVLPS